MTEFMKIDCFKSCRMKHFPVHKIKCKSFYTFISSFNLNLFDHLQNLIIEP